MAETDVGWAIVRVLTEIDDIAKATFRSITIETLLKLVAREQQAKPPATTSAPAQAG